MLDILILPKLSWSTANLPGLMRGYRQGPVAAIPGECPALVLPSTDGTDKGGRLAATHLHGGLSGCTRRCRVAARGTSKCACAI
jgi:hypothetical protein